MSRPSVAILGLNGYLGRPIIKALTSAQFSKNFTLPIVGITRDASKQTDTESVVYKQATLDDVKSLDNALKDIDVLINVGPFNPDVVEPLLEAAVRAGIKLYIPSQFGPDTTEFTKAVPALDFKNDHTNRARALGLKTVDIFPSYFAHPGSFLYEVCAHIGLDAKARTVTYYGDGSEPVPFSTYEDIGKAVAVIVSKNPATLPDKIRFFSGVLPAEEIVKQWEKRHNLVIRRFRKDPQVAKEEIDAEYAKHGLQWNRFMEYHHVALGLGVGYGVVFGEKNDREFINPNESVFKWSEFQKI